MRPILSLWLAPLLGIKHVSAVAWTDTHKLFTIISKPDECNQEGTRLLEDKERVALEYAAYIDESSEAGQKGFMFESSRESGELLKFQVGTLDMSKVKSGFCGQYVVRNVARSLHGICVGEKRRIIVPPDNGWGDRGCGDHIPGGATLRFDVECTQIRDPHIDGDLFDDMDDDWDDHVTKSELMSYYHNMKGEHLSDDEVEDLWRMGDRNGDGILSREEAHYEEPRGPGGRAMGAKGKGKRRRPKKEL